LKTTSSIGSKLFLEFYDRWMRIEIEYPGFLKESFPGLVRIVRPAPRINTILYSHLDESKLDSAIQEQVDHFAPLDQPFEWVVYDYDQPENLIERLIAHGFAPDDDPEADMVLDIQKAPAELLKPSEFDIRQITQREQLDDVVSVEQQVLGADFSWLKGRLADHLSVPGYLNVYVGYINDIPVTTAWIYFHPNNPFAGLFGGSTLPEYRQRGLYTALVGIRLEAAKERGYSYLTTGASEFSRPILEKNGFVQISRSYSMKWRRTEPEYE
jgi:GNAT superfamily N-acetyltransferase